MGKLGKVLADLKIQSMMFDMDIDWDLLILVPKSDYKEAVWLTRWKEKQSQADFNNELDAEQE